MGKASSSKKVQRAARAAASSRGASERRELGFPLVIGLVVVLGIGLLVAANWRQDSEVRASPKLGDHWHSAYSVWDCDSYARPFEETRSLVGIHSHADSLVHIHPSSNTATGENAQLGVFLEAARASVDEDAIDSRETGRLEAGSDCNGEETVIRVARFRVDPDVQVVEVFESDFDSIRLADNREAFTIARVPADAEIPPPDQAVLDHLDEVSPSDPLLVEGDPSTVPVPADGASADDTTATDSEDTASEDTAPGDQAASGDDGAGADAPGE